ncbi:Peroxisomal membrane protein pex16 [Chytriomyces hyalinus]|nr:Peroxisomal membrane protein pex16 [Chytriomyces hyalinus]
MQTALEQYKRFLIKHAPIVGSVESLVDSVTYVLPGRFAHAEVVAEGVHSLVAVVAAVNDALLSKHMGVSAQSQHNRYTHALLSLHSVTRVAAYAKAACEFTQVFAEMMARDCVGTRRKWGVIAMLESVKLLCRIILFHAAKKRMLLVTQIPERDFDMATVQETCADSQISESMRTLGSHSGKTMPDLSVFPKKGDQLTEGDVTAFLNTKAASVSEALRPMDLVSKLSGADVAAEWLHMLRPLVYLLAMRKYGNQSWKPWVLSLCMEVSSIGIHSASTRNFKFLERDELQRRIWLLMYYLLRDPFYSMFVKHRLNRFCESMSKKPLISLASGLLADYIPLWENYYFLVNPNNLHMTRCSLFLLASHLLLLVTATSRQRSLHSGFLTHGQSSILAKHQNNISIALILPYSAFWNFTTKQEYDNCGVQCSWWREMDSGAELAVAEVNENPNILPNTLVNIVRVEGWDWQNGPGGGVGLAAASAIAIGEDLSGVVGVVGDTLGSTTLLSAAILSQYRIPMCGAVQNLPSLSNKHNLPYFWRITFSNTWGREVAALLTRWNVKRVAMVFDRDDVESAGACDDIKAALSHNFIILSERQYRGSRMDNNYSDIINEFLRVDARYIILCASAWSASYDLVRVANASGLISPKHAWIATNPPFPADYSGVGSDPRLEMLQGMIFPFPFTASPEDSNVKAVSRHWANLYQQDPLKYQIDFLTWTNAGMYDCTGTMLYGFHQLLETRPHLNSVDLYNRAIPELLNFSAFKDTGFNGTLLHPVKLDGFGDIAANTLFVSYSDDFVVQNVTQLSFAEIDKVSGTFVKWLDPLFHGGNRSFNAVYFLQVPLMYVGSTGATEPPFDGSPVVSVHSIFSVEGRSVIALLFVGFTICALGITFLSVYRRHRVVRSVNVPHTVLSLVGSIITLSSMATYLIEINKLKCTFRVWLVFTGFLFIVSPLIVKNFYVRAIFAKSKKGNTKFVARLVLIYGSIVVALAVVEQAALFLWLKTSGGGHIVTRQVSGVELVTTCRRFVEGRFSLANALLVVFNLSLLGALIYVAILNGNMRAKYNESSVLILLALILFAAFALGAVESDQILPSCVCIFLGAVSPPVLIVGERFLIWRSGVVAKNLAGRPSTGAEAANGVRSSSQVWLNRSEGRDVELTSRGSIRRMKAVDYFRFRHRGVVLRTLKATPYSLYTLHGSSSKWHIPTAARSSVSPS